jgi:hypothetical protein
MTYDGSTKKVVEFVEESSFGTIPADPTFENFGAYINNASVKKTMVPVKIPYLKDDSEADRLQSTKTQKVSEAFASTITMNPTDWSILPYILCAPDSTTYEIGDNIFDLGLGIIVDDQYELLGGGCWNKYECTIASESVAEATLEGMYAKSTGISGTDYVTGTGTHASTPSGDAIKFGDLSSVQYDSADTTTNGITIDSITFGVEYSTNPVKDVGSSLESNTAAWSFGQRNISLSLNMTLDDMTVAPDILDGAGHDFEFAVGGKTLAFSNIFWEGDWDEALDPDDLIAMPLSATNVDLTIT